ncbi:MAG TPA: C25 family cysteine peptidase [Planctomycetota bacterium]|nr:C25 family cysteine peptidase [Planctomycetota bacterium]
MIRISTAQSKVVALKAAFVLSVLCAAGAYAASGTWVPAAGGGWGTASNWNPAAVPGSAAGDIINIMTNITATATITLDANRTAGTIVLGDADGTNTFALTGNALTLNQTGGALFRFGAPGITTATTNSISSTITLASNARFYSTLASPQTLSGVISGAFSVTYDNDDGVTVIGPTALQGQFIASAANTYTGTTTINDVRVNATNAAGLGTGACTVTATGQVFLNSAITVANAMNITGNGWAETAAGQPFGALRIDSSGVISGAVTLASNASIGCNTGTGTVSGVVSGASSTLTKVGAGTLVLSGANTYGGGTTISSGVLQLNSAAGAGTGTITLGPTNTTANRLQINGGVTIANTVTIPQNVTGASATSGVISQTGTGQSRINGSVTVSGTPTTGGTFSGSATVGNELVLGGSILGTVPVTQIAGRVIYAGPSSLYSSLSVTGTALAGATNGVSSSAAVTLGGSGTGTLDLNGFDQSLSGLTFGTAATANTGIATIGARTLTLTGDINTVAQTTGVTAHAINATTGTLSFGATPHNLVINDTPAQDDLVISGANITASGGLTQSGAGTLAMNGVNMNGILTVSAGSTLATGKFNTNGSLTTTGLTFLTGASNVRMKIGATNTDLITVNGPLVTGGTTTLNLTQFGGNLTAGTYPLIKYTGTSPGLSGFALAPVGHTTSTLVDTGTAIALSVTANDQVIWDGTNSGNWQTGVTGNWKLATPLTATDYIDGDDVVFNDNPTNPVITIPNNVTPSRITFNNATTAYSLTGTGTSGILGSTGLTLNGAGLVTLNGVNSYGGATTINAGTLEVVRTTAANTLVNTSGVTIAAPGTLKLDSANVDFTFDRNIGGTGTVLIDTATGGTAAAHGVTISGTNTGFTGLWKLTPTGAGASGTFRTVDSSTNQTTMGTANIEVDAGGQLWHNASLTNNIVITGTGFSETGGGTPAAAPTTLANGVYVGTGTTPFSYGGIGAVRMDNGTTLSGNIVTNGNAKVMAFGGTGTLSGTITSTNTTDVLYFGGGTTTTTSTHIITGNLNAAHVTVNSGSAATATTQLLQIGNNTASGTLSTPETVLFGQSACTAELRFSRSDGYTMASGQTIVGGAATSADLLRTKVTINTTGTGFNIGTVGANTIGLSDGTNGGYLSVANVATGGILNIGSQASIAVNQLYVGDNASCNGTVNQVAGSVVNVIGQVRVGHFATETSTYNMQGGTLTLIGPSSLNTPSVAAAGGNGTNGDNNLNTLATAAVVGGGIYVGIDGTGVFNHTGGTVTTNWLVMDNRTDTPAGQNMPDGIDRYNLSGASSVLAIRSAWGLIQRNPSSAVSFGGGTIRIDNSGTGGPANNTGPNIVVPLDATIDTVTGSTTTLDTNAAVNTGNAFTLTRDIRGTGTLALIGGGTLNFNPTAATQNIAAKLTGSVNLVKLATTANSITTISGSGAGYTGNITVSAGRLNVPNDLGAGSITVADTASLGGEPVNVTTLTLGATTGCTLFYDPTTAGAITTSSLVVNGTVALDVSALPTGLGPFTVINYTTRSGAGTFVAANAGTYRGAPVITDTGTSITITFAGSNLTWTGAAGTAWNLNSALNWVDPTPTQTVFFNGDSVTFPEGGLNPAIALAGTLYPFGVTVNNTTTNYTFTASAGNQLSGSTGLIKTGTGTLTLTGPELFNGPTTVGGGTVVINAATSLGSGNTGNNLIISGGGKLSYTTAGALDFGVNRNITVGTGGGSISFNNATAENITISGNLVGTGPDNLSFASASTAAGTYILSGVNSAFAGSLSVDAASTGITTLRILYPQSAPGGGSITVNYPPNGASGNATTLDMPGTTLPAGVTLNLTSFLNGAVSLRTQVTCNSGVCNLNGPLVCSGTAIIQFSPNTNCVMNINGNVTAGAGGFNGPSSVFFVRGNGTGFVNGVINLPGGNVDKTDAATWQFNTPGGNWASTGVLSTGSVKIGANDALATNALLNIGQGSDNAASLFDLNGFNQTVNGLTWTAGNGNSARGVGNTGATPSTLTLNSATDYVYGAVTGITGGNITGNIAIVKNGTNTQTFSGPTYSYTGNVTVNSGTLVAGGNVTSTALGNPTVAGRTVTVNSPGILSFTTNNVFGNGIGNANLPAVTVSSTLTSTRYNVLGNLTLNGALLTQASTDTGIYQGFQFLGGVTVGGTAASSITTTNAKGNHLAANTVFSVADVTGDSNPDLIVNTPLIDQSGDFASAAGGLTKTGAGTMSVTAAANTFTGPITVNAGTLSFSGTLATPAAVAVNSGGALQFASNLGAGGAANTVSVNNGKLSFTGAASGTLNTNNVITLGAGTDTLDVANTVTLSLPAGIANSSTGNLVKTGPGTLAVTGNVNLNGGSTTVSGGTLQASFGTNGTSTINVAGGASLKLIDANSTPTPTPVTLTLSATPGALTVGGGAHLGLELGAAGTNDEIVVAPGGTAVTSGTITLDLIAVSGFAGGSFNLLAADSGLKPAGVNYVLGTAPQGFNYTITATDTLVKLQADQLVTRYWTGNNGFSWTATGPTNWSDDSAGLIADTPPNAGKTGIFSASSNTNLVITTTVDSPFVLDSMQFISTLATQVNIGPGIAGTLTFTPSSAANGLSVGSSAGIVNNLTPVTLGANQTWFVDGTGSNGSAYNQSGDLAFNNTLTKTGAGLVSLSGNGTGSATVTLAGGTLALNSPTAIGNGTLIIQPGTTLDNTLGAPNALTANNPQTWNGSFTFAGSADLDMGTGAVTANGGPIVTVNGGNFTVGGVITGTSLTKAGGGTLIANGNNNLSSSLTVNGGTLSMNGNNTLGPVTVNTGGTLTLSGANTIGTGVTLAGGTININANSVLGVNPFTIGTNSTLNNTSGSAHLLSANNVQSWGTAFTFLGASDLNLGTGAVTMNPSTNVNATAGTLTVGGVISGITLTKSGGGTLALGALNAYTGNTVLDGGTLRYLVDAPNIKTLQFGAANGSVNTSNLDLSNANMTATSLLVVTNNAVASTISIGTGKTLSVTGPFTMGYDAGGGTGATFSNLTVSGAGTLSLTSPTVTVGVNQAATNAAYWSAPTLDVTALTSFTSTNTTFNVGVGTTSQGPGTVLLSNTANTIVASTLTVGDTGGNNGRGTGTLRFGTGTNVIQADAFNIGRGKNTGPGVVNFASQTAGSPGTVTVTNKAGTGPTVLTVGFNNGTATAGGAVGTLDLRGHASTVSVSTMVVGSNNMTSNTGGVSGTVNFDTGTFTVTTLSMGTKTAAGTGGATGTLTVGGGAFTINTGGSFLLGSQATAGTAAATLNVNGGTFTSNADITQGGGTTTSTITVNGGTLDMTSHNIGGATPINVVDFQSGTVRNIKEINAGAFPLSKSTGGTLIVDGTNTYTGGTTINGGTLQIAPGSTLGSVNATLTASNGTLDLDGNNLIVGNFNGLSGTIVNNLDLTNKTLTIGSNNATGGSFSGAIFDNNNATTGTLAITKIGNGTQTLNGTTFNTGATTVSAGTLIVGLSGTISNSAVTVNTGAILRGVGTVANVTTAGGTLFPGTGNYHDANPAFAANQILNVSGASTVDLSAGRFGVLLVPGVGAGFVTQLSVPTGTVKLGGASVLSVGAQDAGVTNTYGPTGMQYVVITQTTASITNSFASLFGTAVTGTSPPFTVHYFNGGAAGTEVSSATAGGLLAPLPADTVLLAYTGGSVTPAKIANFSAKPSGAGVLLSWTAISEYQNAGFNLYRRAATRRAATARERDGIAAASAWTKVNPALIAGRITNAASKEYAFYDWASEGAFDYKLESMSLSGEIETQLPLAENIRIENATSDVNADGLNAAVASLDVALATARAQQASAKFAALPGSVQIPGTPSAASALARQIDGSLVMPATIAVGRASEPVQPVQSSATAMREANGAASSQPALDAHAGDASYAVGARWFTASSAKSPSFTSAKVLYSASGVMRIPQSALPAGFNINRLSIQREGVSLPALAVTSDALIVYGAGYSDDYTDKDALFLRSTNGATSAGTIQHAQGLFEGLADTSSPATAAAEYHDVYFDYTYRPYTFTPWFSSQYLTASAAAGTTQTFMLDTPLANSNPASLTVNLWSLTQNNNAPQDHALQVLVNGQPAGQASWSGGDKAMTLSFQLPAGALNAGSNQIDLVTPPLPNVDSQIAFLHSLTIGYTKALDGSTAADIYNPSLVSKLFELSTVSAPNVWVVDERYPDRAALIPFESQPQPDGTYRLRFDAAPGGSGHYQVVPFGQENAPLSVTKRQVKPVIGGLKYIATGPNQFSAGVQPLLASHTKEGLRAAFVDQEQLFDYYNYGRYGPTAIQSMVRSARPQYLLLVGRTTYDYHNYSGANVDPMCPTFLVSTSFWAQATSDSLFGDLGRGIPEVAVGRLPVNDTGELSGAVSHILNYSGAPASGVRMHAVADQPDPDAGDFPAQADSLAQAHSDLAWQRNYLGVTAQNPSDVTAAMTTAANGGADWLLYIGHGNALHLGAANRQLLGLDDLQNWTGNVVLLQSTCTANWMANDVAGYKSLAIQALTQPQGGISAGIGTSSYMNSANATAFMDQLLSGSANAATNPRWGNVLMKTQQWAFAQSGGFNADLGRTEQLFGDPAMPVFAKAVSRASAATPVPQTQTSTTTSGAAKTSSGSSPTAPSATKAPGNSVAPGQF